MKGTTQRDRFTRRPLPRVVLFACLLALFACLGCSVPMLGADDVELTYETAPEAAAASRIGDDLRALVLRRLGAATIGADVTEDGQHIRVVVGENRAESADELLTWSGTLLVLEGDPSYAASPRDEEGLTARTLTLEDGRVERYWEGSHAAIMRALQGWTLPADHRVVGEPLWETARGGDAPRWRTRVLRARPIGELADGVMVGWGDGGTLRLRAQKGSPAETVVASIRARTDDFVVRGRTSLGRPTFESDALVVSFGSGIEAYGRAQDEKQLLTTPRLPTLKRVVAVGLPPNTALAAACFVIPILLSFGWLGFVRRFDRAHPEPMWLILVTFLLGAAATVPAGLVELGLSHLSPWLDPRVVTLGGQTFALPLSAVVFTVVVGFVEEGAKFLGAIFAARRPEFDEPVDGIVYGIVSSLGFAAAENVQYFAESRLTAPLVIARCFMSVPAHMFFGAIWGYALGAKLVEPKLRVGLWLAAAAAAHGLFDALLATDGAGLLAVALNVALASVFVLLVQRALRHGVVDEESKSVDPTDRRFFRVGRPALFALSSLVLHALAFGIFLLGAWYQLARHRPGVVFVVGSSVMLALLAIAALGVASTMPLDVAVDGYGVTFAGAARSWRRIRGFDIHARHILLDCEAGPIHLGPGSPGCMEALARTLRMRLGTIPTERLSMVDGAFVDRDANAPSVSTDPASDVEAAQDARHTPR